MNIKEESGDIVEKDYAYKSNSSLRMYQEKKK